MVPLAAELRIGPMTGAAALVGPAVLAAEALDGGSIPDGVPVGARMAMVGQHGGRS